MTDEQEKQRQIKKLEYYKSKAEAALRAVLPLHNRGEGSESSEARASLERPTWDFEGDVTERRWWWS